MPIWKKYTIARTVEDALSALEQAGEPSRLIAGGTDLLLDLQQGRHPPVDTLVDVTGVPEMNRLEIIDPSAGDSGAAQPGLLIGASVPLSKIIASDLVRRHAQGLVEAADLIGGPQVRHVATLGGNVAHALPAADGAIALLALGARALVATCDGRSLKPLIDLYAGPGQSTLDHRCEILVGFLLPLKNSGEGSSFARIMRPQGVALPIINMAAWVSRRDGAIQDLRLALGPAGQVPQRCSQVEDFLRGKVITQLALDEAYRILLENAHFRTSPHRASAGYRQQLAGVLLREVITKAWNRAGLE